MGTSVQVLVYVSDKYHTDTSITTPMINGELSQIIFVLVETDVVCILMQMQIFIQLCNVMCVSSFGVATTKLLIVVHLRDTWVGSNIQYKEVYVCSTGALTHLLSLFLQLLLLKKRLRGKP